MVCRGTKPDPPERSDAADLPLFAALLRDRVTLYADLCGASLHRRGYRSVMHRASLNEAAAAGVLALAGWTAETAGQALHVIMTVMAAAGTSEADAPCGGTWRQMGVAGCSQVDSSCFDCRPRADWCADCCC